MAYGIHYCEMYVKLSLVLMTHILLIHLRIHILSVFFIRRKEKQKTFPNGSLPENTEKII